MTATAVDPLAHAVPLQHPADFTVRTHDRTVRLYEDDCLDIEGQPFRVFHNVDENQEERVRLFKEAETDPELQEGWLWAVSRPRVESFLLWLNWFGRTYVSQTIDEGGHQRGITGGASDQPFVTWPCQDRASVELFDAITLGHDCVVDKSRQMGATWLIASMFAWFILYRPNTNFEILSRTEELVDLPGDPRSIGFKLDYLVAALPPWIKPRLERHRLKWVNPSINSTIMGRSTASGQGRGGAVSAVLIDEAAQIDVLDAILTSYGQSTACRVVNSTPFGYGPYAKLVRQKGLRKIILPWWEHPEKGRGRTTMEDPENGEVFITSPFYEGQCRRASPDPDQWWLGRKTRGISQELDMDHSGAANMVFDYSVISRQISLCPPHPTMRGEIIVTGEKALRVYAVRRGEIEKIDFVEKARGKWEFWIDLEEDENGFLRPPQNKSYCLGADVSQGSGASESTIVAYCPEERRKLAQYRDANISPLRLAFLLAAAGWWFGGTRRFAFVVFESNGYGQSTGRGLAKLRYPWLFADTDETRRTAKVGRRLGWHSDREKKIREYEGLRDAMASGEFDDPSPASLGQMMEIVHYETGGIGPAALVQTSEEARSLHADLVTANVLAFYGSTKMALTKVVVDDAPKGSAAWRRKTPDIIRSRPNLVATRGHPERPNPFVERAKANGRR